MVSKVDICDRNFAHTLFTISLVKLKLFNNPQIAMLCQAPLANSGILLCWHKWPTDGLLSNMVAQVAHWWIAVKYGGTCGPLEDCCWL